VGFFRVIQCTIFVDFSKRGRFLILIVIRKDLILGLPLKEKEQIFWDGGSTISTTQEKCSLIDFVLIKISDIEISIISLKINEYKCRTHAPHGSLILVGL